MTHITHIEYLKFCSLVIQCPFDFLRFYYKIYFKFGSRSTADHFPLARQSARLRPTSETRTEERSSEAEDREWDGLNSAREIQAALVKKQSEVAK